MGHRIQPQISQSVNKLVLYVEGDLLFGAEHIVCVVFYQSDC